MKIDRRRCGSRGRLFGTIPRRIIFYEGMTLGSPVPVGSPQTNVPQAPRSNGWRCRVIKAATAKEGFFAITVNDINAIGVIAVLSWSAAQRNGNCLPEQAEKHHGR